MEQGFPRLTADDFPGVAEVDAVFQQHFGKEALLSLPMGMLGGILWYENHVKNLNDFQITQSYTLFILNF